MRYYELTCLGDPSSLQEKITNLIQGEGGILVDSNKKSNLITFSFQMEPANLANLEKKLKTEGGISRYIMLAKKPQKTGEVKRRHSETFRSKQKVELKEIEQKLEEILGQ